MSVESTSSVDYDADGDLDIFLGTVNGSYLLINEGRGQFSDVLPLSDKESWTTGGTWGDVNADGSLNPAKQVFRYTEGSKVNQERQAIAHTHSVFFSPKFDRVLVPDLGADKIRSFNFTPEAKEPLSPSNPDGQATLPGRPDPRGRSGPGWVTSM
jgi:hypothetical protein